MPDSRRHRGPHPVDEVLFAEGELETLRQAAGDLAWLLGRGYSDKAALKLVGDRFQLHSRQRVAVVRAAVPAELAASRAASRTPPAGLDLVVDGFNLLVTMEAALSGGVLIRCADGLVRDIASMHGNYRKVAETEAALDRLVDAFAGAASVTWYLDRPVSNSGRVAALLRDRGQEVVLSDHVDSDLRDSGSAIASADGPLLDEGSGGVDVISGIIGTLGGAWVIDLS